MCASIVSLTSSGFLPAATKSQSPPNSLQLSVGTFAAPPFAAWRPDGVGLHNAVNRADTRSLRAARIWWPVQDLVRPWFWMFGSMGADTQP
jgi:hypothetical protein